MPALTIKLSPDRVEFARRRAAELGLASTDELFSKLLDAEDRRRVEHQRIESLLLEGQAAGPGELVTDEWWDQFDTEVFGRPLRETGL